jgi:hypothetical protein
MRRQRGADDSCMGNNTDRPWGVFARRPTALATLWRSERERTGLDQARVEYESLDEGLDPLAEAPAPREPRAGLD